MTTKKLYAILFGIAVFSAATSSVCGQPPDESYTLLFEENFKGKTVNENDWRYRLGPRVGTGIDGFGLKENVFVSDSGLHILAKQEMINGKLENTGGGIISRHQFGYGYYETLSKPFMQGTGVHCSFWQSGGAFPNNSIFEIDSYEIDSKYKMGCNNLYIHLGSKQHPYVPWPCRANLPFEFRPDGWFLDAYEYTPEGVTFYDNGKVVARAEWRELTAAQVVWLSALNGVGKVDAAKQPGETLFKYFRYYAKPYPGINLLPNGDFEYNMDKIPGDTPIAWQVEGNNKVIALPIGASKIGDYHLRIGHVSEKTNVTLYQVLEYILNDSYQLSAWVKVPPSVSEASIVVSEFGKKDIKLMLPTSDEWKKIVIPDINVQCNKVKIAIQGIAPTGAFISLDDLRFFKPNLSASVTNESGPQKYTGEPVWKIAQKYPIDFKDDKAFYFFDRNVGLGDLSTIHLEITADKFMNTSPIARMPKQGNSGWAIRLNDAGDISFSLGSMATHTDVIAKNAYRPGIKTAVTCTYDKGEVAIYSDGELAVKKRVVDFNMDDKTAAGKMGNTGTVFEAVGEVMAPSKDKTALGKIEPYNGRIENVQVFNNVLSPSQIKDLIKK
ncbi:LamG-like jellyroll fold domain-containing protein [Chryseolinea lacunae]|uniref:Family 16 glycosylhydrolase n=1 Tax=Chryseolinea lacunae TaxID=2801331 RepID=A0ABS1L4B4_9BACT|nr:LamG-like jellyroll fold domain-containing protein [Chryseolinea lacunae]MBL0745777.1 family 16 glycosylhydrolase [Chryseolinea lacunae]